MSRYTDRIPAPLCEAKRHRTHVGIVSNLGPGEPLEKDRPHAATSVCGRQECQDDAREWVRAHTREPGLFATFEQNRAASAARDAAERAS